MRFALIGDHPDGLAMARALVATGRHRLSAVCAARVSDFASTARVDLDLEEILADPAIELVIVAGPLAERENQLRRAVQSERHVLCAHPSSEKPDLAYEVAVIQADTKKALLPLLPMLLHPALTRMKEIARGFRLLKWEWMTNEEKSPAPSWEPLRAIGGEIAEVMGFAATETWNRSEPLLIQGRFESGSLFQVTLTPGAEQQLTRFAASGSFGEVALDGPDSRGAATLRCRNADGQPHEQTWPSWDSWEVFVPVIEAACANPLQPSRIAWQDEIHGLELDDALRRSIEKRKAHSLEYREATEDAGGKGTMTLIGCGMIWLILLVFGLSIWIPWIRWAIVPMLAGFLLLLALQWLARKPAS